MAPSKVISVILSHWDRLRGTAEQSQAFCFCLKALILALGMHLFVSYLLSPFGLIFFLLMPILILLWFRYKARSEGESLVRLFLGRLTLFPFPSVEKARTGFRRIPWLTYSLIFLMGLIYFGFQLDSALPERVWQSLVFLPTKPNLITVPTAAIAHVFLHVDTGHYLFNMLFLWVIGTTLEPRIGWPRMLGVFLLTGVLSGLLSTFTYFVGNGRLVHGMGASGAIAGLMGVFGIRCYFKVMSFPLPLLGLLSLILPLQVKVRMNSLTVIAFLFMDDFFAGAGQLAGSVVSKVDHWAHIWGLVTGMIVGLSWSLQEEAQIESKIDLVRRASGGLAPLAKGIEAAKTLVQLRGQDPEVLLHLARMYSRIVRTEEGQAAYRQVIELFLKSDHEMAITTYKEYQDIYGRAVLGPNAQFRMAQLLDLRGETDMASRCLDIILESEDVTPELRIKSLYHQGRMLKEMGYDEAAEAKWQELSLLYPDSPLGLLAKKKLSTN